MNARETVGNRLREERLRLRESQDSIAVKAGVGKNAQIKYEKGERSPDADLLLAAEAGVDVLYVLTGARRPETATTAAEIKLLARAVHSTHGDEELPLDMHKVEEAYSAQYERAIAAGQAPNITLTDRHLKLLAAFDRASEPGRKTIERIAHLESARAKPNKAKSGHTKVSAQAVEINGDGNVIGAHNRVMQTK